MGPKVHLKVVGQVVPSWKWRVARRITQSLALVAIALAPLLGGWQRLERRELSAWEGSGWDLPGWIVAELPGGDAARKAHELNELLGGGSAVEYFGVPILDPVAGTLVTLTAGWTGTFLLAWSLPLLLALIAGRAFCGWFCPFGTLARWTEALVLRLPFRVPHFEVPSRRPVRWVVLAACVVAGVLGFESALYLALPHSVFSASVYGLWLMGGAGALLGWLVGLIAAGLLFGPTLYCASICPTGALLSLVGSRRWVRVTLSDPSACGTHCDLCARACWLHLDPASGDPGMNCDNCARCFGVCPRVNLVVGVRSPWSRVTPRVTAALLLGAASLLVPCTARAQPQQPALLLEARDEVGPVSVAISLVDLAKLKLDADAKEELSGVRLSLAIARGSRSVPDAVGRLEPRESYSGPVVLDFFDKHGDAIGTFSFDGPNAPRSTPRRKIYRADLDLALSPGNQVVLRPIDGWLGDSQRWCLQSASPSGARRFGMGALAGFLLSGGLMAMALAVGRAPQPGQEPAAPC